MDYNYSIDKMQIAPVTNRGVVISLKDSVFLLFDWLQATFCVNSKKYNIYDIFFYLFGIDSSDVLLNEKSPHFGYSACYSYRDICIFSSDRDDMGYHLYMTGSACRDFEELGFNYRDLFVKLFKLNVHFTRVDVSIDDFTGKYFPLKKIKNCIINNSVVTKFRSSIQFLKTDLNSVDDIGCTIWFGSRASDIQFVFYDKFKERVYNAGCTIDDSVKAWNRFEMRYRNVYADTIIVNYLYVTDFNDYILGVINNYISFRVPGVDKIRSRWKYQKWWSSFIDTVRKVKFQTRPVEYDIVKKKNWILRSCSYSMFITMLADIKDLSSDNILSSFIFDTLKNGSTDITDLQLQKLNQYRIKNNLVPITRVELIDFIKDIKDVLIQKNSTKNDNNF